MREPIDPKAISALATRISGAASVLTAADMGLVELTAETLNTIISTLRDAADRLEALKPEAKEAA